MPKTFTPKNIAADRPKILLSATGPLMTKVAAETADGLIMHPFSTEKFIREVNIPAIEVGLQNSDLKREDFTIDFAPLIATGKSDEEINAAKEVARGRIAFYGSTPGYKMVLDAHGWGELQPELNFLMKQHRTEEMAALISDEILNEFTIIGSPMEVAAEMLHRFGDIIDRSAFTAPTLSDDAIAEVLAYFHAGET
jgi:probable F420-dependent oxidoreductase